MTIRKSTSKVMTIRKALNNTVNAYINTKMTKKPGWKKEREKSEDEAL